MDPARPRYRRVLVKLSGEALMGSQPFGIEPAVVGAVAAELGEVAGLGVQIAVVVGGGNIIRGVSAHEQGIDRITSDSMGMVATVINALALSSAIEQLGLPTRVQTAIQMNEVAEPFIRRRAIRHLEKGRVTIFVATRRKIRELAAENLAKNVNQLIDVWGVALRLHPEYGTAPNLFYIPPLSPPTFGTNGQLQPNTRRIPTDLLATMFGDDVNQSHAQRVARIEEIFGILETERAKVRAGGSSPLVDILTAHDESDRMQLYLG